MSRSGAQPPPRTKMSHEFLSPDLKHCAVLSVPTKLPNKLPSSAVQPLLAHAPQRPADWDQKAFTQKSFTDFWALTGCYTRPHQTTESWVFS
jgi:hypothetical protein